VSLGLTLALRAIRGRPLRSLLTAVAVALGIALVLGVAVTLSGLDAVSRSAARASAGGSDVDVRVTAGTGMAAEDAARLGALPGVGAEAPLYEKRVIARLTVADVDGTTVNLLALHGGSVALRPLSLASGRLPTSTSRVEVVVDQGLAVSLARSQHRPPLRNGDTIELTTVTGPDTFTIVGISNGGGLGGFTRNGVFVTDTAMLGQFRLGLRTALVALRLSGAGERAHVVDEVHTSLGAGVTTVDARAPAGSPLAEVQPLLLLLTVLSVLVGAGSAATSVALAASERRRETGLLRAAGASSARVIRLFVLEIAILAAAAIPVGVLAGVALAGYLETQLAPLDLPPPGLHVSALQVVLAIVSGVGAAVAGGAVTAYAAGRPTILAGMRPHPGAERERLGAVPLSLAPPALIAGAVLLMIGSGAVAAVGAVLVVAGVVCSLPLLAPLTVRAVGAAAAAATPQAATATRNLVRRRNRTALTLSGLTTSVAVAVAVSALAVGAVSGGDAWVTGLFSGNVVVRSPVAQTAAVEASIASTPGVQAALPLRFLSVASGSTVLGITTVDTASYEAGGGLDVTAPARAEAFRAIGNGAEVLVPSGSASERGWLVGSVVPLLTGRGTVRFRVAGIVAHSYPSGNGEESLIMDRGQAVRYFGDTAAGFDALDISSSGNPSAVAAAAAAFGLSAVGVDDIRAGAERALQHALGLLLAVAVVALVMSMIAVVNTLVVNIRQGSRELSMIRAVGLDRRGVRRLALTEAAVLAVSGAILGVATGCALVVGMLRAVATPQFAPSFTFPLLATVAVVGTVVAGSLIAAIVPATRAARSSIVAAIRQD